MKNVIFRKKDKEVPAKGKKKKLTKRRIFSDRSNKETILTIQ